jgi:hypothetical protein
MSAHCQFCDSTPPALPPLTRLERIAFVLLCVSSSTAAIAALALAWHYLTGPA